MGAAFCVPTLACAWADLPAAAPLARDSLQHAKRVEKWEVDMDAKMDEAAEFFEAHMDSIHRVGTIVNNVCQRIYDKMVEQAEDYAYNAEDMQAVLCELPRFKDKLRAWVKETSAEHGIDAKVVESLLEGVERRFADMATNFAALVELNGPKRNKA